MANEETGLSGQRLQPVGRQERMKERGIFQEAALVWNEYQDCGSLEAAARVRLESGMARL